MARTTDHEIVSIYPFSDDELDQLMKYSGECVLMWATKDGWPVGVIHAFVWHEGRIWLTFAAHRHRAAAIRRDNRVSVCVSSASVIVCWAVFHVSTKSRFGITALSRSMICARLCASSR